MCQAGTEWQNCGGTNAGACVNCPAGKYSISRIGMCESCVTRSLEAFERVKVVQNCGSKSAGTEEYCPKVHFLYDDREAIVLNQSMSMYECNGRKFTCPPGERVRPSVHVIPNAVYNKCGCEACSNGYYKEGTNDATSCYPKFSLPYYPLCRSYTQTEYESYPELIGLESVVARAVSVYISEDGTNEKYHQPSTFNPTQTYIDPSTHTEPQWCEYVFDDNECYRVSTHHIKSFLSQASWINVFLHERSDNDIYRDFWTDTTSEMYNSIQANHYNGDTQGWSCVSRRVIEPDCDLTKYSSCFYMPP